MADFRDMVNTAVGRALRDGITSRSRLCAAVYRELREKHPIPSYYHVEAINIAAAALKTYRKASGRKRHARIPHFRKPFLSAYLGFRVVDGVLLIPVRNREWEEIPLNGYARSRLDGSVKVHSFSLNAITLSLTIGREPSGIECTTTVGIDRNLRNATVGNERHQEVYDLSDIPEIAQRYRNRAAHFRRDDVRIRKRIASKYFGRKSRRVRQMLHRTSREIVGKEAMNREAIVLENIRGLKDITKRGDGKGPDARHLFHNSFPYGELQCQIEYKAQWEGLPVIELTRKQTRGTSVQCSVCGCDTQVVPGRMVLCEACYQLRDRDVNACINIAVRGRTWLKRSLPKGPPGEAVNRNPVRMSEQVIRGADDGRHRNSFGSG